MIPIHQTKFGNLQGNCFAACIASILEIPIEDVPNFCVDYPEDWFFRASDFVRDRYGYVFVMFLHNNSIGDTVSRMGYSIVGGKSPRGDFGHSVVYYSDRLAHDPHPSGDGIIGDPTDYILFVAINPAVKK